MLLESQYAIQAFGVVIEIRYLRRPNTNSTATYGIIRSTSYNSLGNLFRIANRKSTLQKNRL